MINSYPSIYNLGHKAITDLPVLAESFRQPETGGQNSLPESVGMGNPRNVQPGTQGRAETTRNPIPQVLDEVTAEGARAESATYGRI